MNKRLDFKNLLLGVLLGVVLTCGVAAVNNATQSVAWEYQVIPARVFQHELQNAINSAVNGGWDLVSVSHYIDQYGMAVLRREKK